MPRFLITSGVALLLLFVTTSIEAVPRKQNDNSAKPAAAIPLYPESEDGLKNLIGDIFGAMKSGKKEIASSYFASLEIPDHITWFTKTFGPVEGPRLEAKYEALLREQSGGIQAHFDYALKGGRTNVELHVLRQAVDANTGISHAILDAMVQALPLYSANGTSPTEQYPTSIGDFVYIDGGFRFVDPQVFLALSTAPPPRLRVGGNVQAAKLIHKVAPIYPDEAKATHAVGPVVFHVIIGANGKVKEIMQVSGDPVLAKGAADSLRQWQYQPTLLNGTPAEVDTVVTFDFRP